MYKLTWRNPTDGVVHIVAMPSSNQFSACSEHSLAAAAAYDFFKPGVATCLRCWAREFLEWEWEANAPVPERFMR